MVGATATVVLLPPLVDRQTAIADQAEQQEARERFDQGMALFNEGNHTAALAEFKRAYTLLPKPVVLFNIGLVYAATGRPVEATDALDRVLASSEELSPDDLQKAVRVRREQLRRVATLELRVEQPGAVVEVDGIQVGQTPLQKPIRLAVGTHRITVAATGFHPLRKEVTLAGSEASSLQVELVPLDHRLARLSISSQVPDGELFVDGKPMGKTPLPGPLNVSPGTHELELRRVGYRSASATVKASEGGTAQVMLEPLLEAPIPAGLSGTLKIEANEPEVTVRVDGQHPRGSAAGLVLPYGKHSLRVERAGFVPIEREVWVKRGALTTVQIELQPTAESLARSADRAAVQRTWGWIALASGIAITTGGVGYLVYNAGEIKAAQDKYDAIVYASERNGGGECDPLGEDTNFAQCEENLSTRYENVQNAKDMAKFGYIAAGTGAVVAGLGLVLLLTGDDPDHHASAPSRPGPGSTWLPVASVSGDRGWFGLSGRF